MKNKVKFRFVWSMIFLIISPIIAVSQFVDDFSDGDFTSNPSWTGEAINFEVDGSSRLHLIAPAETDISHLSTISESINDASWEFTVEFDFNPSSANFAQVFLTASAADLEGNLEGYFVRIGNTDKEVSLYRQDANGDREEIIDGMDDVLDVDPVNVRIKVTRSENGDWDLSRDLTGGTNYISEGVVMDTTYQSSNYFGVYCKYTSTRSELFYFSDFIVSGDAFLDIEPPVINNFEVLDQSTLSLIFSEPMDLFSISNVNSYIVSDGIGNPNAVDVINSNEVQLNFSSAFGNGQLLDLSVLSVFDLSGNSLTTDLDFSYFEVSDPVIGDVIINEIMADPNPSQGLPEFEYLEIYNRSDNSFDLENWVLVNTETPKSLSGVLPANSYLIICDEDNVAQFSSLGPTVGISSLGALANSGDSLTLISSLGDVMDIVSYTSGWYQDTESSGGGFSIERMNPFLICSGMDNWRASIAIGGGTPGSQNSVFNEDPDLLAPSIVDIFIQNETEIVLVPSENILEEDLDQAEFLIDNGIFVANVTQIAGGLILIELADPGLLGGTIYTMSINNLQDCSGNILIDNNTFDFGLPESIAIGDLVINEILFNPRSNGVDFVEVYNKSDKYLSLKNTKMASIEDGFLTGFNLITTNDKLLFPQEYLVVTADRDNIILEYENAVESNIFKVDALPSYNDDEGTVVFLNDFNEIIDSVGYDQDYHLEILDDLNGVSLERLSFDDDSSNPGNWHSASELEGFATPGYENSQFIGGSTGISPYSIEPRVISPDNDGFQDVLAIQYNFSTPGFIANVTILDEDGRFMGKLTDNQLLGTSGNLIWDGILDDGTKASVGIYILYLEFFDSKGKVEQYKEVITVAARL